MNEWISVEEKLPASTKLKKYNVKMLIGSVDAEEVETVVLGRMYHDKFRFVIGSWQTVIFWKEFEEMSYER